MKQKLQIKKNNINNNNNNNGHANLNVIEAFVSANRKI